MTVLAGILSGASSPIAWGGARGLGRSSRLYRALVDGELASGVAAGFELTLDPYLFTVEATLRPEIEPARVEAVTLAAIERIQREGVPADELERVKRQLRAQVVYSLEGVTNQGFALGFMDTVANDASAWETFPARLQTVTSDEVQQVAQRYLREQQRTVGWFTPTDEGAPA